MKRFVGYRFVTLAITIGFLLGLGLTGLAPATVSKAAGVGSWQDSGLSLPSATSGFCPDAAHPGILFVNEGSADSPNGTWAYNWQTGQKTQVNSRPFSICGNNGYLYATEDGKPPLRFSLDNPAGQVLAHTPFAVARDGSLMTYALDHSEWVHGPKVAIQAENHLWVSEDGGLTWQERALNISGVFWDLAVSPTDGRAIYFLTRTLAYAKIKPGDPNTNYYGLTLYFSGDGGQTWDKRSDFFFNPDNPPAFSIEAFTSSNTPVTALTMITVNSPIHEGPSYSVSFDGGRTFKEYEYVCVYDCGPGGTGKAVSLVYGAKNLLRLDWHYDFTDPKHTVITYDLVALQPDGNWQSIPIPADIQKMHNPTLQVVDNAPDNLLLSGEADPTTGTSLTTWYSPDSGQTWQQLPGGTIDSFIPTSYAPLTLLGVKENHLLSLALPGGEHLMTRGAPNGGDGNSPYFSDTGHNMSNLFKTYWETHGGLAQFGYPWTEPFREVNPSDGKIYTVQYFERNRFEYHPENKGTPYEVELGLLGNQLTMDRRNAGEGAFNRFSDMHYPGGLYFPEVGHNLRNSFKDYWVANGGLAIYGYPITEEFEEKNPDDGKTYVVQYFERARFEYHPEYKGTKSEVLLGLLGNSLLRLKGWL